PPRPAHVISPYPTLFRSIDVELYPHEARLPVHRAHVRSPIDEGEHEERERGIEGVVLERDVEGRLDGSLLCTVDGVGVDGAEKADRKSTRLNSSHGSISY